MRTVSFFVIPATLRENTQPLHVVAPRFSLKDTVIMP